MGVKYVNVTDSVSIPVPNGLSSGEEADFIANRIGFVDFDKLEAECAQALRDLDDGKLVDLRTVLEELETEMKSEDGLTK